MASPTSFAAARYSPLYFLAALGAGGLVVTFFMYLLFWVPHPGRPVPTFEDVYAAFQTGGPALQAAIGVAVLGILGFSLIKLRLLVWNLSAHAAWTRTPAYVALRESNAEAQLLAAPLTVAMAINVGFILGLVFVPGLWSVVEYLFPAALAAFLLVGVWALRLMAAFWGRILVKGGFDCSTNNNMTQLVPAFALSMVGVGLAAPAAMSQTPLTAGVAFMLSSFFLVAALALAAAHTVLGLRAIMERGADAEAAPSALILIPIVTVSGIALMRQNHGLHAHFGEHNGPADAFALLTMLLSLQVAVALFGLLILNKIRYFGRFVYGVERSPGSYALVCPGVALVVLAQFFINKGLVDVGLMEKFGVAYWVLTGLVLALQAATILLVLRLNAKHFARDIAPSGVLAE